MRNFEIEWFSVVPLFKISIENILAPGSSPIGNLSGGGGSLFIENFPFYFAAKTGKLEFHCRMLPANTCILYCIVYGYVFHKYEYRIFLLNILC